MNKGDRVSKKNGVIVRDDKGSGVVIHVERK